MLEQMGIADAIKLKLTIMQAIDGGVDLVAQGKAEVGLFNISEILPVQGVALVGPLPTSVQSYIVFAAALHARSRSPGPASISFVGWPSFAPAVMVNGWKYEPSFIAGFSPAALNSSAM